MNDSTIISDGMDVDVPKSIDTHVGKAMRTGRNPDVR